MAGEQDRFISRVESPGIVEQLTSVNPRVSRKKENSDPPKKPPRRRPSVEELLEEEREEKEQELEENDGHIDIHA